MFSEKDLQILRERGISPETIREQLDSFIKGIDFVKLTSAATPGNGIIVTGKEELDYYNDYFTNRIGEYSFTRFIPASGAASRMFKALFEALDKLSSPESQLQDILDNDPKLKVLAENPSVYPFYEDLKACLDAHSDKEPDMEVVLKTILGSPGLNYGSLPKGLLKFHKYTDGARTAFEEHFVEASFYLVNNKGEVNLHFTVSPEHRKMFTELALKLQEKYSKQAGVSFKVAFSEQKASTDTIAVNPDNTPFRTEEGDLLFRPGGHGALLENLNDLEEMIVFIGNIDNIAPDRTKKLRVQYKKLLGGILIEKAGIVHGLLKRIEKGERSEILQKEILEISAEISPEKRDKLLVTARDDFFLEAFNFLNRPVRICGMVKNVGEPGGGPFWVRSSDGTVSKQVIESSQINMDDPEQLAIFSSSSHFNPVDLACYIRDFRGEKFSLMEFRDPAMAFISKKSMGGRDLKALELPGLWNGSMAGWLTWFVDVPMETFSPVKTVYDLVREEHLV